MTHQSRQTVLAVPALVGVSAARFDAFLEQRSPAGAATTTQQSLTPFAGGGCHNSPAILNYIRRPGPQPKGQPQWQLQQLWMLRASSSV